MKYYECELGDDPQEAVALAVEKRGYFAGYTYEQLLARQVAKFQEELGELSTYFHHFVGLGGDMEELGWKAREVFTRGNWTNVGVISQAAGVGDFRSEIADLQVIVFCMAYLAEKLTGEPFDVVQAAIDKSSKDIERGVR